MTIRIAYKNQNGIKQTMHYYNIDRVRLDRNERGLPCLYLTTITGRVLATIVDEGSIEYATVEETQYWGAEVS